MSRPFFYFIRTYNRRFAKIARRRRQLNLLGRTNRDRRCLIPGFTLKSTDIRLLMTAIGRWVRLELSEGWHTWFERGADRPVARLTGDPSRSGGL